MAGTSGAAAPFLSRTGVPHMPSVAISFIVGMATAAAIAVGFAGAFMEQVERHRLTNAQLRPPPGSAVTAILPASNPPTTTGLAVQERPAVQVEARTPMPPLANPAAAPLGTPTKSAVANSQTSSPKATKPVRKHLVRRPKNDWRDEPSPPDRNWRGGGLFGFFR